MANKDTAKPWFKTGLIPTQAQFYSLFDFLRWKDEKIPIADIEQIEGLLNAKAEAAVVTNHLTSATAHATEFNAKEDKNQKGEVNGYAPLNEFALIAAQYLSIVDDFVTGGGENLASAETVKTLKTEINAINLLLTSDNINLDTVQEIVDAIENVQSWISTIIVDDLTTGGHTKTASAETVKTLKGLVDGLESSKFSIANISQDIEADKTSTAKVSSVKQIYDWAAGKFKSWFYVINTQAGITYTFAADDYNKLTVFTSTNAVSVTVPTNAVTPFAIGTTLKFYVQGTGDVTISGAGVTFINSGLVFKKGNRISIIKTSTNTWQVQAPRDLFTNTIPLSINAYAPLPTNAVSGDFYMKGGNLYFDGIAVGSGMGYDFGNAGTNIPMQGCHSRSLTGLGLDQYWGGFGSYNTNFTLAQLVDTTKFGVSSLVYTGYHYGYPMLQNGVLDAHAEMYEGAVITVNGSQLFFDIKGQIFTKGSSTGGVWKKFIRQGDSLTSVIKTAVNLTLTNAHNGKVILLTASATITLPNGLMTDFGVTIATATGATLTLSVGGSVTLINNAGTSMPEKLSCTLLNTGVANEYLTSGSL